MGTRSLTRVFKTYKDEKKNKQVKVQLVNMYRQYDGYPSGHGSELAEFLNGGKVVNGIGVDEKQTVFNGAGCLAAQMIAHFKDGAGGFYIYPITAKDCGQEYEYEIIVDFDTKEITLKCIEVGYIDSKGNYKNGKKVLFEGSPSKYEVWLEEYETA
jgi:hypothetical protein